MTKIYSYLADDIQSMNNIIVDSFSVKENLIAHLSDYLLSSGGKRIRPILTILIAKMYGYNGSKSVRIAAAVEFIHMATLLHDDVIDGSTMRRFLPTANIVWGNKASILVGDFMFSQSFKLIVATKSFAALEILSNASTIIAEGEVAQLVQLKARKYISREDYFKIINAKTAELFGAACSVGAIIAEQDTDAQKLQDFGLRIGTIFQIVDDMLDYFSESKTVGKNIGDDFYEGKITLPLILLMDEVSDDEKILLNTMLDHDNRSKSDFCFVLQLMHKYSIKRKIEQYLQTLKLKAELSLSYLNIHNTNNQSRKYLRELVSFAINRSY